MRYDVNLSIVFTELPLLDRPAAARDAGFDAVEMWWPFPVPEPADREIDALLRRIADAGVRLVGLNFDAGDMGAGERGLASLTGGSARFRANIDVAVGIAEATGCRVLNALYGNRDPGVDPRAQEELAVANVTLAAEAARRCGATVVVEPLNSVDNPDYPLTSATAALAFADRVDADNVALLADFYHLTVMGEDPLDVIERHAGRFGHVQIADAPGRGAPGTGSLPLDRWLAALDRAGYEGWVALEHVPG